ncbi:MAG: winged helix-turn-helix transcriptional regulator [Phycisphaerales bacterium]|nr:winged helix-turn-helix transcriptional regulator [Phycisphaerales bacterium]
MNADKLQRLAVLSTQLAETLMTAAICANEIRALVRGELDAQAARGRRLPTNEPQSAARPLVDDSTFTVSWGGRTCPLRHTVLFRLAARLARHPNQYISADQLLHDVWEQGVKSGDTIRSAVHRLRQRFDRAGMHDLAAAIHGTGGRYGLILNGRE